MYAEEITETNDEHTVFVWWMWSRQRSKRLLKFYWECLISKMEE